MVNERPISPAPRVRVLAEIVGPNQPLAYYWVCEGCEDTLARSLPEAEAHAAARQHAAGCMDLVRARRHWDRGGRVAPATPIPRRPSVDLLAPTVNDIFQAMSKHPAGSGRQRPRVLQSDLTGRVYYVTRYEHGSDGGIVAHEKFDITRDLARIDRDRLIAALEADEAEGDDDE